MMNFNPIMTVFFGVVVLYLAVVVALSSRLKSRHYATWDRLGRFSLFFSNSVSNGFAFLRYFIFSNSYRELGGSTLNYMALGARILFGLSMALFLWNSALVFTK